jgi:hypothetical protein
MMPKKREKRTIKSRACVPLRIEWSRQGSTVDFSTYKQKKIVVPPVVHSIEKLSPKLLDPVNKKLAVYWMKKDLENRVVYALQRHKTRSNLDFQPLPPSPPHRSDLIQIIVTVRL